MTIDVFIAHQRSYKRYCIYNTLYFFDKLQYNILFSIVRSVVSLSNSVYQDLFCYCTNSDTTLHIYEELFKIRETTFYRNSIGNN